MASWGVTRRSRERRASALISPLRQGEAPEGRARLSQPMSYPFLLL